MGNLYCQKIHILFGSALIHDQEELRKEEYLKGYYTLKDYGFNPWIIEATNISCSFYDTISDRVLYPQTNNPNLKNKGVNEVQSFKTVLSKLPFNDDDIVVKLTGRYLLYEPFFLELIKGNPQYDSYVKWIDDQIFTGCFALKWKHFKRVMNEADLVSMENDMINVEKVIANFILHERLTCFSIDKLHILARVYGTGQNYETLDW